MRLTIWILTMAIAAVQAVAVEKSADESEARSTQESREREGERDTEPSADRQVSIYIPPARGAPASRTGGGTRAPGDWPELVALVPDHVARTAEAQPHLAWYLDAAADAPLELTVLRDGAVEPLVEAVLAPRAEAGFGGVSLARLGVELEEGVVYQWHVALVPDPERRDRDVLAGGAIERVAPPLPLVDELAASEAAYRVLARRGLWYDALAELSASIDAGNEELRDERRALLAEVGIEIGPAR